MFLVYQVLLFYWTIDRPSTKIAWFALTDRRR